MHPEDVLHATDECDALRRAFLAALAPDACWINPLRSRLVADDHLGLRRAASACGLKSPPSLCSNDPLRVRAFAADHGDVVAIEPVSVPACGGPGRPRRWRTTRVTEAVLGGDADIAHFPALYQHRVDAHRFVRVVVMGQRLYAMRLPSSVFDDEGSPDRGAGGDGALGCEALPAQIQASCFALMRAMRLVFACIDLVVTIAGEYRFVDLDEQGDFLFLEDGAAPLLDAFCHLLREGRLDAGWTSAPGRLRCAEVAEAARMERVKEAVQDQRGNHGGG